MGSVGGGEAKNRPQTKVVELVEGYKSHLKQIFDIGSRWLAKREILSGTRRCEGVKMLPGKYPTSAESVVTLPKVEALTKHY